MSAAVPVEAAPAAGVGVPMRPWVVSVAWLLVWLAAAGWTAIALATAWPYVQLMPQWLLLIALPGILFRAFDLAWMRLRRRRVAGWRRWLARVGALVAGVFAAGAAWTGLDAVSMARFERAMHPLIERLQATREPACPPQAGWDLGEDFTAYLRAASAPGSPVELHLGDSWFVLAVPGRSMDIDGSTMFYESRDRRWRKVHNDALARTGELAALTSGLALCTFRLR